MLEKKYIRLKAKFERETQENTQKRDELIQRLYASLTREQLKIKKREKKRLIKNFLFEHNSASRSSNRTNM